MRRSINGKYYNIASARKLGFWASEAEPFGAETQNFRDYTETLYVTRTGNHFLYTSGGLAGRYAQNLGESRWVREGNIIPISPENAKKWGKECLSEAEFFSVFGTTKDAPGVP